MSVAAQAAGVVGSFGLAALYLAPGRIARLAGLVAWAAGLGVLAVYLLPDLSRTRLAAAAVGGLAVSAGVAVLLRRWPYFVAFATLACIPLRLPVDIGDDEVNLLLPLYAVIGGLALSLGWSLLRGDERARELGPVALPLAAFVAWTGLSLLWAVDVRRGAILLGAFLLPFGLLAIGFARLPWRGRWLAWLWGGLVATALAYALVGGYQWLTRDVFWNPSVKVFNAYAPFFRVNSVFWDPSVYGRYLTVAILASLAGIVLGGVRGWRVAGLYAVVVATWLGLLISFSQSSFVALAAGSWSPWPSRGAARRRSRSSVSARSPRSSCSPSRRFATSSSASRAPVSTGSRPGGRTSSARARASPSTIRSRAWVREGSRASTRAGWASRGGTRSVSRPTRCR